MTTTATREQQLDLLDLVATDTTNTDRARSEAAIRSVASRHGGVVDPNIVRSALTDCHGDLTVRPRVLAATYSALARMGVLVADGRVPSTDLRSRNRHHDLTRWRLATT